MTRWVAMVAALAVCGCEVPAMPFHGDTSFTEAERVDIERGNVWLAEQTGLRAFEIVWDATPGTASGQTIVRSAGDGARADAECNVFVGSDVPSAFRAALVAHEFGHCRGLGHVDAGIMQPVSSGRLEWTADDRAECLRAHACL